MIPDSKPESSLKDHRVHEIISTPKVYFICIYPQIMIFFAQQGEANEGLELDEMDKDRNGLSPNGTSSFF